MSISPFSARVVLPPNEGGRARLLLAIALIGIGATLLAYALSPGVRHAVSHAAHSVRGAVTRVFHDSSKPAGSNGASSSGGETSRGGRQATSSHGSHRRGAPAGHGRSPTPSSTPAAGSG